MAYDGAGGLCEWERQAREYEFTFRASTFLTKPQSEL